jgi:NAD dependent epimerase/dehydratase
MVLKNQQVLVTGAGGFIGSHLVESLVAIGADVTAFCHYNSRGDWGWLNNYKNDPNTSFDVILGDVADFGSVRNAVKDKDVVFHLAALIGIPYSYTAANSYIQTNIIGSHNVFQASLDENVGKVIHTSTSEVYGTAQYTPIDEKHPLHGQSPYSATKIGADKLAESYYCSFELNVTTIRPFNVFGPRQSCRAVIPTIITQALSSDTIYLGSTTPVRDFTYVSDTVQGFIRAAKSVNSTGDVINIGTGNSITIGEIAEHIIRTTNPNAVVVADDTRCRPEKSEVFELLCDNKKAQQTISWKPTILLTDGLEKTIRWFQENLHLYNAGTYSI